MTFSIICLTYKRTELLEEAVYSVLQQTCPEWELLIINDYDQQTIHFDHSQVRIFNFKDKFKTIAEKRNFGVENALGDYILQLDDDDFLLPHYLEVLKKYVSNHDLLSSQRPILYYDDPSKICLSPLPQTNTFVYKRFSVGKTFHYETKESDEGITLNPFYQRVITNSRSLYIRRVQLKPDQCGYVWRQDVNDKRKYSLAKLWHQKVSTDDQIMMLSETKDECGDIFLTPKWSKDYVAIIKENIKESPIPVKYQNKEMRVIVESVKFNKGDWEAVKPTWSNALKFLAAAKSRGVVSTALDAMGVSKAFGDRVSDEVLQQRRLSCFGDKGMVAACSRLRYTSQNGYFCGGCGCGKNELARLDADSPDEYTKLHYPELQCPLKKKGFSNYEAALSIVIPTLNDAEETNKTIESIYQTSPYDVDVIVIDDGSEVLFAPKDSRVRVFRFDERKGAGQSRHFGAQQATSKYLLFIDSHMRFVDGWLDNALAKMKDTPTTLWCGACLGLDESHMDVHNPVGVYTGADLVLYAEKNGTIFDGVWKAEVKDKDDYEISCVMGACYFMHRDWYFYIKGLEQTMMWGSEEPILSLKTWLAGGEVRLMKSVRIGHKFRNVASYTTNVSHIHYNKLAYMYMILPTDLYEKLKTKFNQDGNLQVALSLVEENKARLDLEKEYYKTIFQHDIYWLCEKFKIDIPK